MKRRVKLVKKIEQIVPHEVCIRLNENKPWSGWIHFIRLFDYG